METMLNESLSREEMDALMGVEKPRLTPDAPPPIWPTVEKLEPARLGAFLAGEHPQTAALVLSKLAPQAAANVLLTLEKSARGEIIKRMMTMAKIPETAIKIVEDQMQGAGAGRERDARTLSAGQSRVANVLNETRQVAARRGHAGPRSVRAPATSTAIRSRLFAFEDILLLTQKARVTLFDGIPTELVTLALRNAEPAHGGIGAVVDRRAVAPHDRIRARLGGRTTSAPTTSSRARKSIATTAIKLAGEGAFELPSTQQARRRLTPIVGSA